MDWQTQIADAGALGCEAADCSFSSLQEGEAELEDLEKSLSGELFQFSTILLGPVGLAPSLSL